MPYQTDEERIVEDIRRLSPIIGKETVRKIRAAYLLGDELILRHSGHGTTFS